MVIVSNCAIKCEVDGNYIFILFFPKWRSNVLVNDSILALAANLVKPHSAASSRKP